MRWVRCSGYSVLQTKNDIESTPLAPCPLRNRTGLWLVAHQDSRQDFSYPHLHVITDKKGRFLHMTGDKKAKFTVEGK